MKKYFIALVILVAAVVFFASFFLVPAYVYNHYELGFRQEYHMAVVLLDHADEGIEVRRGGLTERVGMEELFSTGDAVEQDVYMALQHLDSANAIVAKQSRIPFLPSQYREYHQLKIDSMDQLITAHTDFYAKKQLDHTFTNIFYQSQANTAILDEMSDPAMWRTGAASLSATLPSFIYDLQALKEAEYIAPIEFAYLSDQHTQWSQIVTDLNKAFETGDWRALSESGVIPDGPSADEFVASIRETNQQRIATGDRISTAIDNAFAAVMTASYYYDDADLAHDPLRALLRQRSGMVPSRRDSAQPVIMPVEMNEWRVS